MPHREKRIREIAYLLWEREGRPEGQEDRHWHEAAAQYEAEQARAEAGDRRIEASPAHETHSAESTKTPAKGKAEAKEAVGSEEPAEKPMAAKKAARPKSAKPGAGEAPAAAPAVAAKATESESAVKPAKKPVKRKS